MQVTVTGGDQINKNIARELEAMKKRVLRGMITAAVDIQTATEKELPITPLRYGNLRSSFFIESMLGTRTGRWGGHFKGPDARKIGVTYSMAISKAHMEVMNASKLTVVFGYGAYYAVWVHEMPEWVNWSREGSGPKWFELAIKRNKNKMLQTIGKNASITMSKYFGQTKTMEARMDTEVITNTIAPDE